MAIEVVSYSITKPIPNLGLWRLGFWRHGRRLALSKSEFPGGERGCIPDHRGAIRRYMLHMRPNADLSPQHFSPKDQHSSVEAQSPRLHGENFFSLLNPCNLKLTILNLQSFDAQLYKRKPAR